MNDIKERVARGLLAIGAQNAAASLQHQLIR